MCFRCNMCTCFSQRTYVHLSNDIDQLIDSFSLKKREKKKFYLLVRYHFQKGDLKVEA